jgi:hypothetical protein
MSFFSDIVLMLMMQTWQETGIQSDGPDSTAFSERIGRVDKFRCTECRSGDCFLR